MPFDPRLREGLRHDAVELAASGNGNGAGRRPERGEDAGAGALALLPAGAGHVKGDLRLAGPGSAALELDVCLLCCGVAAVNGDPVRVQRVLDTSGDRYVTDEQMRIE